MGSNYDRTAWFYDTLAGLVYGKSIVRSQTEFLHLIPKKAALLIVGGGTGWILEEIAKIHDEGLKIIYVEVSKRMIARAQKREWGMNEVIFINQPIEDVNQNLNATAVITPFLFDNHNNLEAQNIFYNINGHLIKNGLWLNTDFQLTGKYWQLLLLKSMLLFFKLFGAISNSNTTDMRQAFEIAGYKKIALKTFYGDFIHTDVWQKVK